jgi:hypothetical protein
MGLFQDDGVGGGDVPFRTNEQTKKKQNKKSSIKMIARGNVRRTNHQRTIRTT